MVHEFARDVLVTDCGWKNIAVRGLACIFLIMLAAALLLPPLESLFHFLPTISLDEHRHPAEAPKVSLLLGSTAAKFADHFNDWFDERIGFRDVAIRWAHDLDARLFGVSRKVYIGSNGWLFERKTTDSRIEIERITEEKYQAVEESFLSLAHRLRQRGISLVIIDYPDKSEFYPEYLPSIIPNLPVEGRLARLRRALDNDPDVNRIDVGQLLRPLKASGKPIYYKTDIHIGTEGTIPVVKEIVRRVAQLEDRSISWDETFRWQGVPWAEGSEARFLALSKPASETILAASNFYQVGQPVADGHWIMNPDPTLIYPGAGRYPLFDWEYISNPDLCESRLPVTALFGNSFSDLYWSLGLQRYFCKLRRARTPTFRLGPYLEHLPSATKYVIFEYVASYLPRESPLFANSVLPVASSHLEGPR
jgi:SGNH hydrolase-like domain, acetyltransferase AlgX